MDLASLLISLISIVLSITFSIIVIRQTRKNHRQNIIVEKLEEIFEIIDYFSKIYPELLNLSLFLEPYYNDTENNITHYNNYIDERTRKLQLIDIEYLYKMFSRIEILTLSYCSDKLQTEVLSFTKLIFDLSRYVFGMQRIYIEMWWKEGFPDFVKIHEYSDVISNEIITEIGIHKKNVTNYRKEVRDHIEYNFKKDVGLL